jgi:hypothetical protein
MSRVEVPRSWLLAGALAVAGVTGGGVLVLDGAQSAAGAPAQLLPPIGDLSATASPTAPPTTQAVVVMRSAAVPNVVTETAGATGAAGASETAASPSCDWPDARVDDWRERYIAAGAPISCLPPMQWEGSVSADGMAALRDFARHHRHDPVYGRDPVQGADALIRARYGSDIGADMAFEAIGRASARSTASTPGSTSGGGNFLERLGQHLTAPQPAVRSAGS